MSSGRDEGPVYYREIQKNAYLKRIPNETTSKLLPLGNKKPPLKAMWTLLCVHNGRTPFLEQYPEADCPSTAAHRPVWRACLRSARHVTCSVSPQHGSEYDFLIDTDHGPVRMLAPDWDSMQDWVVTLRSKLHELRIVPKGENVYCGPKPPPAPAPAAPRAAARDPTSPLPAPPPEPIDRVPGIELTIPTTRPQITQPPTNPQPTPPSPPNDPTEQPSEPEQPQENIDISNWEPDSMPSTSQTGEPKRSVAKICGQNICIDDSILKRNLEGQNTTDSDEEFFAEIDRISDSVENVCVGDNSDVFSVTDRSVKDLSVADRSVTDRSVAVEDCSVIDHSVSVQAHSHKSTVVVSNEKTEASDVGTQNGQGERPTNITVIQVVNKPPPPHTAIPLMGPQTNVFNFDIKQHAHTDTTNDSSDTPTGPNDQNDRFVNIVNTEVNICENGYGTVFTKDSDYGHISLATTVSLTGAVSLTADVKSTDNDGIYERLCLASTSSDNRSPVTSRKVDRIINSEKVRKSSLPNLDADSTYEYLFPNNNKNTTVTLNTEPTSLILPREVNSNTVTNNSSNDTRVRLNEVRSTERGPNSENRGVHIVTSTVAVTDHNNRLRSNVERSHSQNAYDANMRDVRRVQNSSPKREVKIEKAEAPKPIWKRGLTELSLLSKLKGLGQSRRQDAHSPGRRNNHLSDTSAPLPLAPPSRPTAAAPRRSRADAPRAPRPADTARRRSSSLTNVPGPVAAPAPAPAPARALPSLPPLRVEQAARLWAEQARGAAIPHAHPAAAPPVCIDRNHRVWIACWGHGGPVDGRMGDRLAAVRGVCPRDAQHARQLFKTANTHRVNVLFHRVPLAQLIVVPKRDLEPLGLRLDGEGVLTGAEPGSPAARARLPPPSPPPPSQGPWALTECNNRPVGAKTAEEELARLTLHGTEASILIQPAQFVRKLRAAARARARSAISGGGGGGLLARR